MEIPIENLYYLLCYAWDALEERDVVQAGQVPSTRLIDLYAKVLEIGLARLIRRGVDRSYVPHREWTPRIRGRILFCDMRRPAAMVDVPCEFDELSHNVLHNQIIKSTAWALARSGRMDSDRAGRLLSLCRALDDVSCVPLTDRVFRQVQLHGNTRFYSFLLHLCELIHRQGLATEDAGGDRFLEFFRDEHDMRRLFEKFIRNFYRYEAAPQYETHSERFRWKWVACDDTAPGLLPELRTDASLTSATRKIIVECKFVPRALQRPGHSSTQEPNAEDAEKLIPKHLFQLFAYIRNQRDTRFAETCEGLLIYPTVGEPVTATFRDGDHLIRVRSIRLDQPWQGIHADLLSYVS